ncbi:MAG: DMT family transporter [Amaricoccus sp.]|uniref:DMT family transporter n=1 Tax=Amaricoccus sp. TaxID=1872485 RepID=UPI0039E631E6
MRNDNLRAAAILALAMLVFAIEDALVKVLAGALPVSEVLGILAVVGLLVFGGLMLVRGEPFWTRDLLAVPVVLRNVTEAVASIAIVLAFAATELSTTVAVMQATPLFLTLGAALWLKEPVGWRRATAIAAGFVGVLMVVRPGLDGFQPASLWAVFAAAGFAVRDLVTRRVPRGMGSLQLSAAAFAALLVASVAMALILGEWPLLPTPRVAGLALACGLVTVTGYLLLVTATRIGEASLLAPVRYTRLVFALLLAVVVFKERLDPLTIAGAAIIVGSGLYTVWHEAHLARRRPPPAPPLQPNPIRSAPEASGPKAA